MPDDRPTPSGEPSPVVPPVVLAERRLHAAQLALEAAHARGATAELRQLELEAERERLSAELVAARSDLAERERARQLAEQREYAERSERRELQAALAAAATSAGRADGAETELRARIAELEAEGDVLERRLGEAEHRRGLADAARGAAEAELARRIGGVARIDQPAVLASEAAHARERPAVEAPTAAAFAPPGPGAIRGLVAERRMVGARSAKGPIRASGGERLRAVLEAIGAELAMLRAALARERELRAAAETRAESIAQELEQSRRRASAAYSAIGALRAELARGVGLRSMEGRTSVPLAEPEAADPEAVDPEAVDPETAAPVRAEPEGAQPEAAEPEAEESAPTAPAARAAPPGPEPAESAAPLDPGRLEAARSRLRTAAVQDEPARSGWLRRPLRLLCAEDAAGAGRLALALLPAQALTGAGAARYDLVLADAGILCVDVPGAGAPLAIRAAAEPRPAAEIDFTFRGDLAALGRLTAAGELRRFRRDRGRISGDRRAAEVLTRVVAAPVRWRALLAAGAQLDGWLALRLAARAIDPATTRGERFAIAFSDPRAASPRLQLQIADGALPIVLQAPLSAPAATDVAVAWADLAPLLAGARDLTAEVNGDPRPLALVQRWIELAQSG